jgi:hypothetical protein
MAPELYDAESLELMNETKSVPLDMAIYQVNMS